MMSSTTSSSHSRPGSRNNPGGEESSSTTRFASAVADGHGDGGAGTTTSVVSAASAVPVERLVSHLLAARQALSDTMGPVLQANALTTEARAAQEEAVVLGAQTAFLRRGIAEEVLMLQRLRRSMGHAYEAGRREFRHVLRTLDAADARLERTIGMLRSAIVEPAFRPEGEGPRSLLDFVEEKSIDRLRDALKESITDLQAAQTSFDGDLLRFDDDIRRLRKALAAIPSPPPSDSPSSGASPSDSTQPAHHRNEDVTGDDDAVREQQRQPPPSPTMADLVASLTSHSHAMAELLTGLTRHFDLCVTAVRITEGGSAALLARRKADGVYDEHHHADPGSSVSISGVMAEQDNAAAYSTNSDGQHLVPETAADRAEMLAVVEQDAGEVDDVVQELSERGAAVARQHAQVLALRDAAVLAHTAARTAFTILEDVSVRVPGYAAAETEYAERWAVERVTIADRLAEMDALRVFYEGYASAYDNLVLEVDRRRAAEDKIRALWRKAKEAVDRVMEADARERAIFKAEVGQYLPTDLWPGMTAPIKRWDVVPAATTRPGERGSDTLTLAQSTPLLSRSVVESARERLEAARQGIR